MVIVVEKKYNKKEIDRIIRKAIVLECVQKASFQEIFHL
jgi:hypothetical protein